MQRNLYLVVFNLSRLFPKEEIDRLFLPSVLKIKKLHKRVLCFCIFLQIYNTSACHASGAKITKKR